MALSETSIAARDNAHLYPFWPRTFLSICAGTYSLLG
jgi:hypothetical protein